MNSRTGLLVNISLIWFYSGIIGLLVFRFLKYGGAATGILIFFLAGVACYDHALFFFLIFPVLAVVFFSNAASKLHFSFRLLMLGAFALAVLPVVLYNLEQTEELIAMLSINVREIGWIERIKELYVALLGDPSLIGDPFWPVPVIVLPSAVLISLGLSLWGVMKDRMFAGSCAVLFSFVSGVFFLFGRTFYLHYLAALPILLMLCSVAMLKLVRNDRLLAIFSGIIIAVFLNMDCGYLVHYITTDGSGYFWPPNAVQRELVRYFSSAGIRFPFTVVNEIVPPVVVQSRGRVIPKESLKESLPGLGDVIVNYGDDFLRKEYKSGMDEVRFALKKNSRKLTLIHSIPSPNSQGSPVYVIYRVDPV